LFDYLVAFGVIGFAGVFRDKFHNQPLEIALGAFLACALDVSVTLFQVGQYGKCGHLRDNLLGYIP